MEELPFLIWILLY